MDAITRRFLVSGLFYLLIGALLGFVLIVNPMATFFPELALHSLDTAHLYLIVYGFLAFTAFGVSYHSVPRWLDCSLPGVRLVNLQFWTANIGLFGYVVFSVAADAWGAFLFEADADARAIAAAVQPFQTITVVFGAVFTASLLLYVHILLKMIRSKKHHHKHTGV